MELKVGDKAPDFLLKDQNNKLTSLKNFKNKWLVLYFYPKDNTPGCTIEAIDFTKHLPIFQDLNAEVVGVSPDSPESHCGFIEKQKLEITLLSDHEHKMLKDYNVWKEKRFLLKKFMGVERTTYLIDLKGIIQHIWNKVQAKGHVEEVKEKLKELQS